MESKPGAEASQSSIAGWFAEVFGQCTKAPAVDGELKFHDADKKEMKKGKKEKKAKVGKQEQAAGSKGGTGAALAVSGSAASPGAKVCRYMVDNSVLQAVNRPGVAFRKSKREEDKVRSEKSPAMWGEIVEGNDEGDGWLKVGDFFLPMVLQGKPVLTLAKEAESPPRLEAVGASSGAYVMAAPLARSFRSGEDLPPKEKCTSAAQGGQEEDLSLLFKKAQAPESSAGEREEEPGTITNTREVQAPKKDATTVQRISVHFGPRILQAPKKDATLVQRISVHFGPRILQVATCGSKADNIMVEEKQMGVEEVAISDSKADNLIVEEKQMRVEEVATSGSKADNMIVEEKQMGVEEVANSGSKADNMIVEEKQMGDEEADAAQRVVIQFGPRVLGRHACAEAAKEDSVPADAALPVPIQFGPRVLGRQVCAEAPAEYYESLAVERAVC